MNINFIMEEQDLNKLIISAVIGACIGLEREYKNKNAGFKTMVMICIGSTLFTIFSYKLGSPESHDRIAANIITGIGFIGSPSGIASSLASGIFFTIEFSKPIVWYV
jgi:putative Mg2+ transporter-C (MgtC) family protein